MGHVMVDLETLDNCPTAVIVSIGAVFFDQTQVYRDLSFYEVVHIQSCIDLGLTLSGDTIAWWMKQSDQARAVFQQQGSHIGVALSRFKNWFCEYGGVQMWGNGASFDQPILANAYRKLNMETPQAFWNDRCYRTVVQGLPKRQQQGVFHNALDDAISQAEHLIQVNPGAIK